MKKLYSTLAFFLLRTIVLEVPGCQKKQPKITSVYGSFCVASTWLGVDTGPGAELYFKGTNSNLTLIWPYLGTRGAPILFTNDMICFIADMPDEEGRLGGGACFAAQASGPAVDVSDDILELWAETNNIDFKKIRRYYTAVYMQQGGPNILVQYAGGERFPGYPKAEYQITWEQISHIIQGVKKTGTQHAIDSSDSKIHVVYLKNN